MLYGLITNIFPGYDFKLSKTKNEQYNTMTKAKTESKITQPWWKVRMVGND